MSFVFSQRPLGYKVGLFLLVACLLLYIIGFSSSHWTTFHIIHSEGAGDSLDYPGFLETISGYNGLWQTCEKMLLFEKIACGPVSPQHGAPGWISAVQGLQCVCLLGLLAACGYAVVLNFIQQDPDTNSRYLEVLLFASGIIGFIGAIIYVSQSSGNNDIVMTSDSLDIMLHIHLGMEMTIDQNDLSWSFGLNLVGCFLAFISSIVLCAFGRLLDAPPELPSVAVSFSGNVA